MYFSETTKQRQQLKGMYLLYARTKKEPQEAGPRTHFETFYGPCFLYLPWAYPILSVTLPESHLAS